MGNLFKMKFDKKSKLFPFWFLFALIIFQLGACISDKHSSTKQNQLFELIDKDSSGIDFENDITTSDSLNIFTFEYIYNGGGVGIGDFNNDGRPDIFFIGNMKPSRLYINEGNFHFKDITSSCGINTSGG